MKNVTKAVLLSTLVYPGVGQLVFQSYRRAIALILVFSIAAYVYIEEVVSKYQPLIDRVKSGEIGLNSQVLANEIAKHPITFDPFWVSTLTYILVICWGVGVIDAYRLGIKKDAKASLNECK
ncbi:MULTISPECIES: hypothetical protein [unclassified Colwellia]|uniref:hypothetical protein n=1 Tax=unclassified Colwellia TaxID=196834 RepID=UPI0015F64D37|nr:MULTISPECIES: hypothetical protein [unclassified Colwellia]MBA6234298.1 hypothetical protein [Colwellia sp. MB02u-7]MBA6237466.1 hypothetical protein [Colwellia sp. MB02u-11]MBA6300098.1 hypothetical protein [Colwellia sp. MB3u-22]MBA6312272.1 hypothetical protein [Colwellia sp. MB3u-64]